MIRGTMGQAAPRHHIVPEALAVAEALEAHGIDTEVRDPRTLLPLDKDGLLASARKTGRVVVFDDSARTCRWHWWRLC